MLRMIQLGAAGLLAAGPGPGGQADLLERANASYRAQRPREAVELYREYLARHRDRADVRVFLGAALLNLDRLDEAFEETVRALALDRNYARGYVLAGRIHAAKEAWEAAQEAFATALRLDPHDREAWYFSGVAYHEAGWFEKAAETFEKLRALGEQSRVLVRLGLSYGALGRSGEAEAIYRRAIRLYPGEPQPYLVCGAFLQKQGRGPESIEMLSQALRLNSQDVEARFELGKALQQAGQLGEAAGVLEPALTLANQCRLHYLLAGIYSRLDRRVEADRHIAALKDCRQ